MGEVEKQASYPQSHSLERQGCVCVCVCVRAHTCWAFLAARGLSLVVGSRGDTQPVERGLLTAVAPPAAEPGL